MKFVDSSFEIIPQEVGLDGLYKHVEKVARVSYKSEDNITEGSAKRMVDKLIENQHLACLEHGTVYLKFPYLTEHCKGTPNFWSRPRLMSETYYGNPYCWVSGVQSDGMLYVTTNARVLIENDVVEDLQYMCEPTEFHEKRYTVKFTWPIGIVRDALRHRGFSFMNESTRYINYTKEKFGGLTIVIPRWVYSLRDNIASYETWKTIMPKEQLLKLSGEELVNQLTCENKKVAAWVDILKNCEQGYFYLTNNSDDLKLRPEQARGVLPLDTKSELVMTGFAKDWVHFFDWRSYIARTGPAHEDMRYLVNQVLDEFLEKGYIRYEELYKKNKMEEELLKRNI